MELIKALVTYLITRKITSSQSMSRWFPEFIQKLGTTIEESLEQGIYLLEVRKLVEKRTVSSEIAALLLQLSLWKDEAISQVRSLEDSGVQIVLWYEPEYPIEFQSIPDKPIVLYCVGNVTLLKREEKVTLVGTRFPSKDAILKARQYSYEAASCGVTTISGLAIGIDTEVFNYSLEYNGTTIAILPQLPDVSELQNNERTLYLSEYPWGEVDLSKWQFIARNRLLAALGLATVVVEAPLRSGTLITADLATGYGRSVYVSLPLFSEDAGLGGVYWGIVNDGGGFIQSLYDVFYLEGKLELIQSYKDFIQKLSKGVITIHARQHKHLASVNLLRYLHEYSRGDLGTLDNTVVELQRFGIIKERKNKIVFNFSGYSSWPKI